MDKISLAGCAILRDNAILLLHRIKTNWYELPGGKMEFEESPEEAAKRECREELMCDVEIIRQIGMKDFSEDGRNMDYYWFLARVALGQGIHVGEPDKFDHFEYIPLASLSQYALSPNMENFAQELTKGAITLEPNPVNVS